MRIKNTKIKINIKKIIGIILSLAVLLIYFSSPVRIFNNLPNEIIIYKGSDYNLKFGLPAKYRINNTSTESAEVLYENNEFKTSAKIDTEKTGSDMLLNLSVFGLFDKEIVIKTMDEKYLILGGESIGVSLKTEGVLVVGFCDVVDSTGNMLSPAKRAGIQIGDAITNANGKKITTAKVLADIIDNSDGKPINIQILRNSRTIDLEIKPEKDYQDDNFHIGIWGREGSSGIGTMTYIDPASKRFGALGHPVTDSDTGEVLNLDEGWLYKSEITAIYKGTPGMPGELMGHFYKSKSYLGDININCKFGLFGNYLEKYNTKKLIKILPRNDVKIGPATIVTTLNAEGPKEYSCEIQKINSYSQDTTKNIVIKVTDRELLQLTGGIVQGMSGSPIVQDGKIVGAVTHVFVNNPTMGHGIFIENMLLAQEKYN